MRASHLGFAIELAPVIYDHYVYTLTQKNQIKLRKPRKLKIMLKYEMLLLREPCVSKKC